MIKKYIYQDREYGSIDGVRQAIWKAEKKVFGKEPEQNKADFWSRLGVEYSEMPDPVLPTPEQKEREVFLLKARLRETDYAVIKIAEGASTFEEYAEVIAQRETWRTRINELEAQISGESDV